MKTGGGGYTPYNMGEVWQAVLLFIRKCRYLIYKLDFLYRIYKISNKRYDILYTILDIFIRDLNEISGKLYQISIFIRYLISFIRYLIYFI